MTDAEDRWLESALHAEPIADAGFSDRIVSRIRRRIWVNRLALPVAVVIGAAFALKPATQLILALLPLFNVIPVDMVSAPMQFMPQFQLIMIGGMLFAASIALFKVFEET